MPDPKKKPAKKAKKARPQRIGDLRGEVSIKTLRRKSEAAVRKNGGYSDDANDSGHGRRPALFDLKKAPADATKTKEPVGDLFDVEDDVESNKKSAMSGLFRSKIKGG